MSSSSPRISVLLPVFNGEPYLASSIESILSQSFSDFELIILNDGSTDNSSDVIRKYSDERIRYFEHPNIGLPATLNKGAAHARGEFIFRHDQDDLSRSDRFETQIRYLEAHADISLLGTWARIFSDSNLKNNYRYHRHPTHHATLVLCSIFDSAFVHSSVAIRRNVFEALGGYSCDLDRQPPEDFELWSRICRFYKVANIPEPLVDYREVQTSMSRVQKKVLDSRLLLLTGENLNFWLQGSSIESFSMKLAEVYHQNGASSTDALRFSVIKSALSYIEKSMSSLGDINTLEYKMQLRRIRYQFMRNYWLGKSRNPIVYFLLKGLFKGLKKLYVK